MCLCKFGQNPHIGSGNRVQTTSNADIDGIIIKRNMSPLTFGWGDIIQTFLRNNDFLTTSDYLLAADLGLDVEFQKGGFVLDKFKPKCMKLSKFSPKFQWKWKGGSSNPTEPYRNPTEPYLDPPLRSSWGIGLSVILGYWVLWTALWHYIICWQRLSILRHWILCW